MSRGYLRIDEPNVIHQLFDHELVAVHLVTGSYHTLAGLAGEVFLMIGPAGAAVSDIAAELAARYDAPRAVIDTDLDAFLQCLEDEKIVVPLNAAPAHPAPNQPAPGDLPKSAYIAPRMESFADLQELFLLDPVHDVSATGWPHTAPATQQASDNAEEALPLQRCRLAGPHVISEQFDNETVAMNLSSGAYHSLSGPAEDIFLLLPSEPTTFELRRALATKYDVDLVTLEPAIRNYLKELVRENLAVVEALAEPPPERELALSPKPAGASFTRPTLETFAQPSFDAPSGDFPQIAGAPVDVTDPSLLRRYTIRGNDLLYSAAGGELVVSDRARGCYFRLNQPASDAFLLLIPGIGVSELSTVLLEKYEVKQRDLRVALMILLANLRQLQLVVAATGDVPPSPQAAHLVPDLVPDLAARLPFQGFDVTIHRDLEDLLLPFNPYPGERPAPDLFHVQQFLALLERYFSSAASTLGSTEESYAIAGQRVTIRCAGSPAAGAQTGQLHKAFAHLHVPPAAERNLSIFAWHNTSELGGPLLSVFLSRLYQHWSEICGPRGEVLDFHCETVSAIYHPGPDTLSIVDKETGRAFYLLRDDSILPFWELSSPFRHILHPFFSALGLQYTHAGAVGGTNGCVLLAGKGGSGKSTTSLLCVGDGMLYASDDYCLTDAEGRVFSLYNTAKLKGPEDLERVPEMRGRSFNSDSFEHGGVGKGTFDLSEVWPERMASEMQVRAILLPTVIAAVNSRLEACAPAEALLALAPSTVAQLPASGQADCDRLAALANKVPTYRLYLGSDLAQIPALLRGIVG